LMEERPTLGGRACSFKDGVTKQDVDNGQHLFLGAYEDTRKFLSRLGVSHRIRFETDGRLPFVNRGGLWAELKPKFFSGNAGLAMGILSFRALSVKDRILLAWGLARARRTPTKRVAELTAAQWLSYLRQSPGTRRAFWDPLCLATLNDRPDQASAEALLTVLKKGLLAGRRKGALGFSTLALSRVWSMELGPYLQRTNGQIATRQKAVLFRSDQNRVTELETADGATVHADIFVSAVPMGEALNLLPSPLADIRHRMRGVGTSPIVAINFWFHTPPFREKMVGFLDMDIQWAFNRETLWGPTAAGQISVVISAAHEYESMTSTELIALTLADLRRAFPEFEEEPRHATVTWERLATPRPTPKFYRARPSVETPLENFFIAGDWVNVGLPPTIEAACRSGHRAAALALAYLKNRTKETVSC
ncbi:MAG: hydroxysqualene dehydroxylase HpnE, partial [Elusimicrobia bacterium]|nr:hydroxysqualene dehydroxylase HpnE [Elusimicrobiota bacterium]